MWCEISMKQIWDFIQGQILGMKWLNELISWLLTAIISLPSKKSRG